MGKRKGKFEKTLEIIIQSSIIVFAAFKCCDAEIAQSVEHFTRNEGVVGSIPIFSFEKTQCLQGVQGFWRF